MEENIKNFAKDKVDERDYKYSDVFEKEMKVWAELPSKFILDNVDYQNQWLEKITQNMCVYYSTWHGVNEWNYQEWSDERILCKDLWLKALELWRLDVDNWAYVVDWPDTARDLWYLKWRTNVTTLEEFKHSIVNRRPIVLWSNKLKWSTWYKDPFVVSWNSWSWHAILWIWYDDNYEWGCIIIKNSYWSEKYDGWKMYIKYEDFNLLFSGKYSLIDSPDPILAYKKKIMEWINIPMAKVGYELWLYNWLDNSKPITREEAVTVVARAMQKVLNWEITLEQINELAKKYWA